MTIPVVQNVSGTLAELLGAYENAGGVIDYVVFKKVNPNDISKEFHRRMAIAAIHEIDRRLGEYAIRNAPKLNTPVTDFFRLTEIDETKIAGRNIVKSAFLGPYFSESKRKLMLRGRMEPHLNHYFVVGTEEKPENIVQIEHGGSYTIDGYAHAFADPPYSVKLPPRELNDLFLKIGESIYGDLSDPLDIFDWAGEWSNYFEAGMEGWGAYLWTVCNLKTGQCVAIGVSYSD